MDELQIDIIKKEIISAIKKDDVNEAMAIVARELSIFNEDGTKMVGGVSSSLYEAKTKTLYITVRLNDTEEDVVYTGFDKKQSLLAMTDLSNDAYITAGGSPSKIPQLVRKILETEKFGSNRTILYAGLLLGAAFIFFRK